MLKYTKKLILVILVFSSFSANLLADNPSFIDFTKVLNQSKSGAEAQNQLQKKFQSESKKFKKQEEDIKKKEAEIISKRKELPSDEYKKEVEKLRNKVADLQKNKQKSFNNIAKSRRDAKQSLLKFLNPIIKKYMEDNNIRVVLDKKTVILADSTLEITDQIIAILNKEVPSLKIN